MKQSFSISTIFTLLFVSSVSLFAQSLGTSPLPEPTGMVNDYANIIEDGTQSLIEQKLRDFKAKTNPQVEISVVIVKTTGDRPIFDYSLAVARGWKIGTKNDDNPSALLVIAVDDRKYFTQVSKDLEDELPDGIVGSLNRQYLVPAFKQANYTKGVSDTVDAYIAKINERASEPSGNQTDNIKDTKFNDNEGFGTVCGIVICIFVVIVILLIIFSRGGGNSGGSGGGGDQDRWRSGGFGGNTSNNSSPIIFWGGGGGSSSSDWGGSSSGGGDSWGGFGGGGDFGGGGSGGDW